MNLLNEPNKTPVLYVVGGFVRDTLLHLPSKDIDFAIEANSYEEMKADLLNAYDIEIRVEQPQYGRLLAGISTEHLHWTALQLENLTRHRVIYCDFVMCRKEGDYLDGRHPNSISPTDIENDLARRDFTINAIAVNDQTGEFIDLFDGLRDIKARLLTTVGDAKKRFVEHPTRILRYYRLQVCKKLEGTYLVDNTLAANDYEFAELLTNSVFSDTIREEFNKMLKTDTLRTLYVLDRMPYRIKKALLGTEISPFWFQCTTEKRRTKQM